MMASSRGPFPFHNSHRQQHSLSHSPSNRRPSTSPAPRPLPSSSSPLVFVYDSPPIPGDPDYQGEDLFVPVRSGRNSNHNRETETGTRGILGTGITTEIDHTAEPLPLSTAAATTAAAVAGNINVNNDTGINVTTSPSTTFLSSEPLASFALPRPPSAGNNRNGHNTPVYSTSTSARTSYTRVDMTAMEASVDLESHVASGQAERREENGESGANRGGGGGGIEENLPSSSLLAVTTTTTTTTTPEHTQQQQQQLQPQEEENSNSNAQHPAPSTPIPQTPQVALCFLLISGKRRVMQFEPETTVGRVKELVWNAWPSDWQDEQPPTPWHIRLLYLGKILQDDDTLKGLSFPIQTPPSQSQPQETQPAPLPPTIVHLSVRPFGPGAPTPDDEIKKKRKSVRIPRWGSTMSTGNDGGVGTGAPSESLEGGGGGGLGNGGVRGGGMCCGCVIS